MYFCNATSRKVMCSKKQETKLKSMFPLGSRAFAFLLFELKARKYNASILMPTSKRSLVFSKNGGKSYSLFKTRTQVANDKCPNFVGK